MRPILLNTVGTSLFRPNLAGLRRSLDEDLPKPEEQRSFRGDQRATAEALIPVFEARDWVGVVELLHQLPRGHRTCGAEINSINSMIRQQHVPADAGLYFFHSDTPDGVAIAAVMRRYHAACGHAPVEAIPIPGLQDKDPRQFRLHGLRNLAKLLCGRVRAHGAEACAFNATGGYKAQVAIAVMLGQALSIPVYYMHEQFSEIISFPPLPIALDFDVWMRASGLLGVLERSAAEPIPRSYFDDDEWDERYESLIETESIDGQPYVALSAAGQIFHETFRERFRVQRDRVLPPAAPASRKRAPGFKADEGHMLKHRAELEGYLAAVTRDVPAVVGCSTTYYNPDLQQQRRFRETRGQIEGIYSNGSWTVKFRVDSTAETPSQQAAVVAALNEWLTARD